MTVRTIDEIFRDFVTDGVPASGPFNPHKPDIRDTLKALTEGGQNFPDNRVIRLNNANEGTANNIVVTASVAIPVAAYQVLYILNVTQENTGAVTVSGAINRTLVTNTGEPIPPGYLTPGMAALCIDTGSVLRLLSYGDAEVIAASAEAAAARAEAARDEAEQFANDAVSQGNVPIYSSLAAITALEIPAGINAIRVNGRTASGDGDGGLYVSTNNGSLDTGQSGGATARTWYRVVDIGDSRTSSSPRQYEGVVATGCKIPTQTYSVNKWITTASRHTARDNIHGLRIAFANWYVNDSQAEVSPGAAISIRAAIEYPRGVVTPLRFAGVGNATINAGETKFTDWLPEIFIPDGETFFIRSFVECPNGIIYSNHVPGYMEAGETVAGAPDYTNYSTPMQSSPFNLGYAPLAVLGMTSKSSVVLLGDSIAEGFDDVTDYYRGNGGYMHRALEEKHAIISLAKSGDSAFKWLTNNTKRAALIQFASHMVIEYGSNDLTSGRSAAALQADIETIIRDYKKPTAICTVGPCTNSTNGWINDAGQTPYASEPQRISYNNQVRAGNIKGAFFYFDIADALETFRNSGKWVTNGTVNYYTDDGVHPSPRGHDRVIARGAVNSSILKRFNEVPPRPVKSSLYNLGGTGTFITPALLRKALGIDQVSFTPTVAGAVTAGVGTYSLQAGIATKVGRLVYFLAMVNWTDHTGFGAIQVKGLPWKNAMSGSPVAIYYGGLAYTSGLSIGARVSELQDYIEIFFTGPGSSPGTLSIENNKGPALMHISGVYFADAAGDYLW